MQATITKELLEAHGAFLVTVPESNSLFLELKQVPYQFVDSAGPNSSPIWLMNKEHINTKSSGKKSYFLFDPENHPAHFGEKLIEYIRAIKAESSIGEYTREKKLKSAVGIHYYGYDTPLEEESGMLEQHNDVNWWSIINTDGPISLWLGEWKTFSCNPEDAPDYLLQKDELVVMRGLSAALIEGGSPVLHRVESIKRKKFTVGIFFELEDKEQMFDLGEQGMSVADFSASYFGVTEQSELVRKMKHEFVRV